MKHFPLLTAVLIAALTTPALARESNANRQGRGADRKAQQTQQQERPANGRAWRNPDIADFGSPAVRQPRGSAIIGPQPAARVDTPQRRVETPTRPQRQQPPVAQVRTRPSPERPALVTPPERSPVVRDTVRPAPSPRPAIGPFERIGPRDPAQRIGPSSAPQVVYGDKPASRQDPFAGYTRQEDQPATGANSGVRDRLLRRADVERLRPSGDNRGGETSGVARRPGWDSIGPRDARINRNLPQSLYRPGPAPVTAGSLVANAPSPSRITGDDIARARHDLTSSSRSHRGYDRDHAWRNDRDWDRRHDRYDARRWRDRGSSIHLQARFSFGTGSYYRYSSWYAPVYYRPVVYRPVYYCEPAYVPVYAPVYTPVYCYPPPVVYAPYPRVIYYEPACPPPGISVIFDF